MYNSLLTQNRGGISLGQSSGNHYTCLSTNNKSRVMSRRYQSRSVAAGDANDRPVLRPTTYPYGPGALVHRQRFAQWKLRRSGGATLEIQRTGRGVQVGSMLTSLHSCSGLLSPGEEDNLPPANTQLPDDTRNFANELFHSFLCNLRIRPTLNIRNNNYSTYDPINWHARTLAEPFLTSQWICPVNEYLRTLRGPG
jgi:hypothetical protein